jgi:hypothetical protein
MKSNLLKLIVCGIVSCLLCGCEKGYRSYAKIELIKGRFVTPLGEFDVNLLSSVDKKRESEIDKHHKDNFTLFSSDGVVTINFETNPYMGSHYIYYDSGLGKTLEFVSIKYHMNGESYPISFDNSSKSHSGYFSDRSFYQKEIVEKRRLTNQEPIKHETYDYSINFPAPLQGHTHSVDAESYRNHSSRVHKIEMEFLLNEKRYVLYVEFNHVLVRESYYLTPYGGVSP